MNLSRSKNLGAMLIKALCDICAEEKVIEFVRDHYYDPAKCYLNATKIAHPKKLLEALVQAEQDITTKEEQGIHIMSIFDYGEKIKKAYLFYQGKSDCILGKKFTVNINRASNVLAVRVEEVIEAIAKNAPDNLAIVGGASSSFATAVHYHECNKPVLMIADKSMNNFKNNFADCMVYDVRLALLSPVTITFEMVENSNISKIVADVAGVSVSVTKLGVDRAANMIIKLIMEAE